MILKDGSSLEDIKLNYKTFNEMILADTPEIAARQLYSFLREAAQGTGDIIVFKRMKWHTGELWEAIFDRLSKAATEVC